MRNSPPRHATIPPTLFTAPKCKVAIPVRDGLFRDALLQASLTPAVRAIRYRAPDLHGAEPSVAGVILDRTDGSFLLAVCRTRPWRSDEELARLSGLLRCEGLGLLVRDAVDIARAPLFSNARLVWSYARYHVRLHDRLKIAAVLAEGDRSIIDIEEYARPNCDVLAAVCALACENILEFDIGDAPLTLQTVVHAR
jgi:hypothetical protein